MDDTMDDTSKKRKRGNDISPHETSESHSQDSPEPQAMSAIAAAKLAERHRVNEPQPDEADEPQLGETDEPQPDEADDAASEILSSISLSASEDHASDSEITTKTPNESISTWQYTVNNTINADTGQDFFTFKLNKNDTAVFMGSYRMSILKGAISINAANLAAETGQEGFDVFNPSTHSLMVMRGLDEESHIKLSDSTEIQSLATLAPKFGRIWSGTPDNPPDRSFEFVKELYHGVLERPLSVLRIPPQWTSQIESCASNSNSTVIIGPPGSGKSTFATQLVNRTLTGFGKKEPPKSHVYFLDLDQLNPKYSAQGLVSLLKLSVPTLGPTFTHPVTVPGSGRTTIKAHAVPVNHTFFSQEYFLACVEDLCQSFRYRNATDPAPLVVDIAGSLFLEHRSLLVRLLGSIKPERVLCLYPYAAPSHGDPFDGELFQAASDNHSLYSELFFSFPTRDLPQKQGDLREMSAVSHFHLAPSSDSSHLSWENQTLEQKSPWQFCYEKTVIRKQCFIGFLLLGEWISPSVVGQLLNVSVVHIARTCDPDVQSKFETLPRTEDKMRLPYFPPNSSNYGEPLDPRTSHIVCTALVRGFHLKKKFVELLIPPSLEDVIKTLKPEETVIVAGCNENPGWAYMESTYAALNEAAKNGVKLEDAVREMELDPHVMSREDYERLGHLVTMRRMRFA